MNKNLLLFSILCIVFIGLSCGLSKEQPTILYEKMLNTSMLQKHINNFKGEGKIVSPEFLSWAYFEYDIDTEYIDLLQSIPVKNSEWDKSIVKCDCKSALNNFDFWEKQLKKCKFDKKKLGNECYRGVLFPFVHDIFIDKKTKKVHHFVSGMSD